MTRGRGWIECPSASLGLWSRVEAMEMGREGATTDGVDMVAVRRECVWASIRVGRVIDFCGRVRVNSG